MDFQLIEDIQNIQQLGDDLHEIARVRVPRVVFRDQENPLEALSDFDFKANLAFTKDGFLFILDIFKDKIDRPSANPDYYISPLLRLTIFLQYLRSNGFYRNVSTHYFTKIPTSTIGRIVNDVAKDIASFQSEYIQFPNLNQRDEIANYFMENFQFPGIIGKTIFCSNFLYLKLLVIHVTNHYSYTLQKKKICAQQNVPVKHYKISYILYL